MPQAGTHYLIARMAIPLACRNTWWASYKPYVGLGANGPDMFSSPLILRCITKKSDSFNFDGTVPWGPMANAVHQWRSYDMFCLLLSSAKGRWLAATTEAERIGAEKRRAFSFGYYCHVITDCIFHPYVNGSIGAGWPDSQAFIPQWRHRRQEWELDRAVMAAYYSVDRIGHMDIRCEDEPGVLSPVVADWLMECLQQVYPGEYQIEVTLERYPLQQAYRAFVEVADIFFRGEEFSGWLDSQYLDLWNKYHIVGFDKSDFFERPYPLLPDSSLDAYTPKELVAFSVYVGRQVFAEVEGFWNNEWAVSAKDYFAGVPVDYLGGGNFNLNTGLEDCDTDRTGDVLRQRMARIATAYAATQCSENM